MAKVFRVGHHTPLIGHIAFGVIDRGTNLLQIRPTSLCPLSCIFCSVDAGPATRTRETEYVVDVDQLVLWYNLVRRFKSIPLQAHIDAAGDPLVHPKITLLIRKLKNAGASVVSLETHGALLTKDLAERMDDAGLDRLNLSIDSLDPDLARHLSGAVWFDVRKVLEVAEYITTSLNMDLLIAPVWVPGVNDEEIPKLIEFALRIGAGKRWPPLGIQKYEAHKYGRKPRGVRPLKWSDFYEQLRKWEDEYSVKLVLSPHDFGIKRAPRVPLAFKRGEIARVKIVGPGWRRGQWLAEGRGRVVTVVGVEGDPPTGRGLRVRILRNKDNIYVAEPI